MNLRDLPSAALAPLGVSAAHPDVFFGAPFDADPEALGASAEAAHANPSRTAPSFAGFVAALGRAGLPGLAARMDRET